MDLEPKNSRCVHFVRRDRVQHWVGEKEQVRKRRAKKYPVDTGLISRSWVVQILAFGAVQLHGACVGYIGLADGEHGLTAAEDAGAPAKLRPFILVEHASQATGGEDESGVDKAVKHLGRGLDDLLLVIRHRGGEVGVQIQHHVEGILVVGDHHREAAKVKVILDVVDVDFAEELVSFEAAEPLHPRKVGCGEGRCA